MGLDMYLRAKRYVSGYDFSPDEEKGCYHRLVEAVGADSIADLDTPGLEITITVAYWRKANQIHKWFVDNVQDGTDDCGSYGVTRDKLQELCNLCQKVFDSSKLIPGAVHTGTVWDAEHPQGAVQLAQGHIIEDPRVAHDLLPTAEGFFFGGTDYDEWYVKDLENTISQINRALSASDEWDFEYQSSW